MKKPLFTAILTAMCMSGFAQSVPIVFGDYNGDGELTVEDLAHIANMITGKEPKKLLIEGQFVDEVKVNSITLNPSSTLVYSGGSTTLTAIVYPEDATNKTLLWGSSNTAVVTVENGVVHGIADGNATITVTANDGSGVTNSCSINVVTVTGVHNGYDYVDLGIKNADGNTIYWATCNVGASTPEEYGQYFAWGETVGYTSENASDRVWNYTGYSLCNGSEYEITKYNSEDGKTVLDFVDDGARVNLGGSWRMPNQEEFELLVNNCDWVWTSINDVEGYMITSRTTSKSIFLPKAGYQGENFAPDWCYYWTSSLYTGSVAWHLANNQIGWAGMRCNGHSIRAVYVPEEASYISGSYSGHNYVDLGLPSGTLWATCNMGADAPEKYGDYYAWGETTPKTYYDWSTYQFGSSRDVSKYNVEDGLTRLESEDDAATVHWGEGWRIPTSSECQELLNNCSWLWKEVESAGELVQGVEFTGKNGNKLFLPAGGEWYPKLQSVGEVGFYWASTITDAEGDPGASFRLTLVGEDDIQGGPHTWGAVRIYGYSIRPVYGGDDLPNEIIGVSSIALSQTSVQITKGNSVTLNATVSPANATDKTLIWSSSNPAVATVEDGVVRGIAEGFATITVEANDGSGVKNTCSVEVVAGTGVTGSSNGHDYVDLGMKDSQGRTIYWATCNIGAESPEDYGLHFAWGETEGHSSNKTTVTQPDGYSFDWSTAPFNNGSYGYDEAYFYSVKDEVCPDGVLAPEYDAAHVNWQGNWRMPTDDELIWLRNTDNCTWTWDSTRKGYTVTSKTTGASIFLPASGDRYDLDLGHADTDGYYWSSTLCASEQYVAYRLYFDSSDVNWYHYYRYLGQCIRPVYGGDDLPNEIIGVSSIALSQTSVQITKGNSVILTATVSPANATDKTLIWSSSNPAVATVEGGVVRGIAEGTATITVEANDGSGVKTTCSVEVVAGTGGNDPLNGYEYVDLGMVIDGKKVVWATCNVGAETPEDYGLYFAWGDTEGHSSNGTNGEQPDGYSFDWSTAPFNNGSSDYDATYFDSVKDEVCPNGILAPEYDAAHVNWKGDWRMPTYDELDWLQNSNNCTWTWDSTKKGYTVTSKTTGASIFLPTAGDRGGSYLYGTGSNGYCWSSSLFTGFSGNAWCLYFTSSNRQMYSWDWNRVRGLSVRPVCVFSE